jgi:hypothetical protein
LLVFTLGGAATIAPDPDPEPVTIDLTGVTSAGNVVVGSRLHDNTCQACHGTDVCGRYCRTSDPDDDPVARGLQFGGDRRRPAGKRYGRLLGFPDGRASRVDSGLHPDGSAEGSGDGCGQPPGE